MSKRLTVGNQVFEYPDNTQSPGWGEAASDWAEAVSDILEVFQGPNDLVSQIQDLPITTGAIPGVIFSTANVASFKFEYAILNGTSVLESGVINGVNNGTTFLIDREQLNDALGSFSMVGSALHYTNGGSGTQIKFSAKTIDK